MAEMNPVLTKLDKIVALEIEQGYENKAVIGGLEGILSWWPAQARQACPLPGQQASIDAVIERIRAYGALTDQDARKKAIAEVRESLGAIAREFARDIVREQAPPARPAALSREAEPRLKERAEAVPVAPPAAQMPAAQMPVVQLPAQLGEAEPDEDEGKRLGLNSPVTAISGIGPAQAARLQRLQVNVIQDLLYLFPRRHEDYSQLKPIGKLEYGEQVTIIGTIRSTKVKRTSGGAAIVNTIIADGSGAIQATWFNQPYLANQFKRGRQIVLSGTVDEYLGRPVMQSPTWEPLESDMVHTGRLVPIYPLTQGMQARWLRRIMKRTVDYWTRRLPDYLPRDMRERLGLLDLERAVSQMHFPDDVESLARARRRLSFDEFFILQLGVLQQRNEWQSEPGVPIVLDRARLDALIGALPYQLTGAQQRVLSEVLSDLQGGRPMSRLLQGDVGSGKTIVAAAAMLAVAAAGHQAALMAPTEILAEQHYKTLSGLLSSQGIHVALLTGSVPRDEKDAIYAALATGEIDVLIGTHAIIQQGVQFNRLALVIVDEQHRFGVRQRSTLRSKAVHGTGYNPHMLVMSATPIPRSLALTLYGDLDLSVIDEMPPGRQPIQTRWFRPAERERAYRFLRAQAAQGHQAYIICPLVEESDKIEAKAAVEEYERLQKTIYPDLRLGLLHGRLKGEEKDEVMRRFGGGELDILVSTSVVEVGIDVPNATVMLIEGANRFGLSQLHQFRGRVGRGDAQSYCILMSDATTDVSQERLKAIEDTTDGFVLAEKDLELRGPGDFFGTRQSGLPELKLASLGDTPLLDLARREAQALFERDPALSDPDHRLLARKVKAFWSGEGDLS